MPQINQLPKALLKLKVLQRDMMLTIVFAGENAAFIQRAEARLRDLEPDAPELKEPTALKAALELRAYQKFCTEFRKGKTMRAVIDSLIEEGTLDQYHNLLTQQENSNGSN
jgi:hypothetical protein